MRGKSLFTGLRFISYLVLIGLLVTQLQADEPVQRRPKRNRAQMKGAAAESTRVQTSTALTITANQTSGDIPLTVRFTAHCSVSEIKSYMWDFGDGNRSEEAHPEYTYTSMGSYIVNLKAVDAAKEKHTARIIINAEPRVEDLKGLSDVQVFGFYSAGFKDNPGRKPEIDRFNRQRMKELQNLNVRDVFVRFNPNWYDSDERQASYHKFLDELHAHGIRAVVKITAPVDWFSNADRSRSIPKDEWKFDTSGAEAKFRATDRNRDGVSDLDGRIDVLYLEHEVHEFANHAERVKMYQLAKRYLPNTPVMMNYAGGLSLAFDRAGRRRRAGGLYDEYQFGPGETDIILIGAGQPFVYDADGKRQYTIQNTIDAILSSKKYADAIAPELPIWVNVNFSGDEMMDADPDAMWQSNEILGWAKAVLSIGDIQGLFLRSYGRFKYDLGHGVNTENPEREETGFVEQRRAVKRIGEWIRSKNGQP